MAESAHQEEKTPQGGEWQWGETPHGGEKEENKRHEADAPEIVWGQKEMGTDEVPEWLKSVPLRLRARLLWQKSYAVPIESDAMVLLYTGPDDEGALDNLIRKYKPEIAHKVLAFDTARCKKTNDMLRDEPYNSICTAAHEKKITKTGGGPMCRTWSIRRHFPKPGGGLPLRGYASPPPPPTQSFIDGWNSKDSTP